MVSTTFFPVRDIPTETKNSLIKLTRDGSKAFVLSSLTKTIATLDLRSSIVTKRFPLLSTAYRMELSKDERIAYVTLFEKGSLGIFDTETFSMIASIPTGTYPHDVKLSSDERLAFVTNRSDGTLTIIDIPSRRVIKNIFGLQHLYELAFTPDETRAYVSTNRTNVDLVYSIDLITHQFSSIRTLGQTWAVAITPDGARLFVSHFGSNKVSVIDTSSNSITHVLTTGSVPTAIRISPDGLSAIVCNFTSNTLSIINTKTLAISTIPVSNSPVHMDINQDGRLAYICSNKETWISTVVLR